MSRALQLGTRKADGNNIPFDLPLSTQNGGSGSTTGVTRASLGLATTDTVVFGALQPTTPLAAIYGGTGFSSFTIGAVPYGKTPTTIDWVLPNTTTTPYYYTSTGTGVAGQSPAWKSPSQVKTDLGLSTSSNVQFNSVTASKFTRLSVSSFIAKKNASQALSSGVDTKVNWDVGVSGNNSIWTISNPSKFYAIATGYWLLAAQIEFQPSTASRNYVNIYVNGVNQGFARDSLPSSGIYTNLNICTLLSLLNGDYVEVSACSNSAAGTIDVNQSWCSFSLIENA